MSLSALLKNYKKDPDFVFNELVYDLACELKRIMEQKGVTKKELAQRLGVSPAYVTKVLGGSNITLKTVARILAALEADVSITLKNRKENVRPRIEKNIVKLFNLEGMKDESEAFPAAS